MSNTESPKPVDLEDGDIDEMLFATLHSEAAGFKSVSVDSLVLIQALTQLRALREARRESPDVTEAWLTIGGVVEGLKPSKLKANARNALAALRGER